MLTEAVKQPAKPAEAAKPSRVDVKLVSFPDANKFKVLKEIRNLKPGMNLMEVRERCIPHFSVEHFSARPRAQTLTPLAPTLVQGVDRRSPQGRYGGFAVQGCGGLEEGAH